MEICPYISLGRLYLSENDFSEENIKKIERKIKLKKKKEKAYSMRDS